MAGATRKEAVAKKGQPSKWEQSDSDSQPPSDIGSDAEVDSDLADEDDAAREQSGLAANYAQFQGESDDDDQGDSDSGDESEEENADDSENEYESEEAGPSSSSRGKRVTEEEKLRKREYGNELVLMVYAAKLTKFSLRRHMLRSGMANIPFSALIKARKTIDAPPSDDDEDNFSKEDEWASERAAANARSRNGQSKGKSRAQDEDDDEQETKRKEVKERLKALSRRGVPDNDDDSVSSGDEDDPRRGNKQSAPGRPTPTPRTNKHAPQEISTRRPVSRKRSVVETHSREVRDPRFTNLSGPQVNSGLFQRSYGFVKDLQSSELSTLKTTLSKLRKMEANHAGPKATSATAVKIREEREAVERALKREEAKAAERNRRDREKAVMAKFKHENDERVKQGGKRYYLKDSDKKKLLLEDKFAQLARGRNGKQEGSADCTPATSSSKALRKAVDKRRRKNAAKERKSMPFLDAGRSDGGDGGSRAPIPQRKKRAQADGGSDAAKRRRT